MVEITNNIKDFIVKKWNELFPPEEVENQTTDQVYITDGSLISSIEEAIRMLEQLLDQLIDTKIHVEGPVA